MLSLRYTEDSEDRAGSINRNISATAPSLYYISGFHVLEVVGGDGAADARQHKVRVISRTVVYTEPQPRGREIAHDLLLEGEKRGKGEKGRGG
jgi:hypothetical protein